jgi:transposase
LKKTIKNYCLNATKSKVAELYELAQRYATVKNDIFLQYGSLKGLQYLNYPRKVRDEWVATKYATKFGLQARQWKTAFDEAFANIKTKWSQVEGTTRKSLYNNKSFTEEEKHYAFYLLKAPALLYKAITFETFKLPVQFEGLAIATLKVHKYLKSRLRNHFGKKPLQQRTTYFVMDSMMYDLAKDGKGRLWVGIMGLKPRARIRLLLTSNVAPEKGANIKIVLKGNRIELHHMVEIEAKQNDSNKIVAIDKGFTEVIATSSFNRYGLKFNEPLKKESDRLSEKNKKRNKLMALVKKYEEKGNFVKAETIKNENLGKKKYQHQKLVNKAKLKTFINTALREFFKTEKPAILVQENLNFTSWNKQLSKKVKRYFSSWLKGYLRERLEYLSQLNGVKLVAVNTAYSSQVCHICHAFGLRKGDKFYCAEHGEFDAEYNATLVLLARLFDEELKLWMSPQRVKTILLARLSLPNQASRHAATINVARQTESELTQSV